MAAQNRGHATGGYSLRRRGLALCLADGRGAFFELVRLGLPLGRSKQLGVVFQAGRHVGVIRAEGLLHDR